MNMLKGQLIRIGDITGQKNIIIGKLVGWPRDPFIEGLVRQGL